MRIYVHQEVRPEAEALEISEEIVIAEALGRHGKEDLVVLVEDVDELVDITLSFKDAGIADRTHVFRGKHDRIAVDVLFNGQRLEHEFGASTRVERVFQWAVGKHAFDLGKADAAEHTLAIASTNAIPAGDVHLGSLDDETPGRVSFTLIPKHRYEG